MGVGHLSSTKYAENSVEKAIFSLEKRKKNASCAEAEIRNHIYKERKETEGNMILSGVSGGFLFLLATSGSSPKLHSCGFQETPLYHYSPSPFLV